MAKPIECTPSLNSSQWNCFEDRVRDAQDKKVSKKEFDLGQRLVKMFDAKLNEK